MHVKFPNVTFTTVLVLEFCGLLAALEYAYNPNYCARGCFPLVLRGVWPIVTSIAVIIAALLCYVSSAALGWTLLRLRVGPNRGVTQIVGLAAAWMGSLWLITWITSILDRPVVGMIATIILLRCTLPSMNVQPNVLPRPSNLHRLNVPSRALNCIQLAARLMTGRWAQTLVICVVWLVSAEVLSLNLSSLLRSPVRLPLDLGLMDAHLHLHLRRRPYSLQTAVASHPATLLEKTVAQPIITIVTYHSNPEHSTIAAVYANNKQYAERYRVQFLDGREWMASHFHIPINVSWLHWPLPKSFRSDVLASHKEPYWAKVVLLGHLVQDILDQAVPGSATAAVPHWLLWIDADALVVNHSVDPHEVVLAATRSESRSGQDAEVDLVMGLDRYWGPRFYPSDDQPTTFNSGVMFLRASAWTEAFLAELWQDERFNALYSREERATVGLPPQPYTYHEQGAMQIRMGGNGLNTDVLLQATEEPALQNRADLTLGCDESQRTLLSLSMQDILTADSHTLSRLSVRTHSVDGVAVQAPVLNDTGWGPLNRLANVDVQRPVKIACTGIPLAKLRVYTLAWWNSNPDTWDYGGSRYRHGDWIAHAFGDSRRDDRMLLMAATASRAAELDKAGSPCWTDESFYSLCYHLSALWTYYD